MFWGLSEFFGYCINCPTRIVSAITMHPPVYTGRRHNVVYQSVRPSVSPSVRPLPDLWTRYLKKMNRFWCWLAQVVHETRTWDGRLWGSGGQSSRSDEDEVEDKSGGVVEASFLITLRWVGFLENVCNGSASRREFSWSMATVVCTTIISMPNKMNVRSSDQMSKICGVCPDDPSLEPALMCTAHVLHFYIYYVPC